MSQYFMDCMFIIGGGKFLLRTAMRKTVDKCTSYSMERRRIASSSSVGIYDFVHLRAFPTIVLLLASCFLVPASSQQLQQQQSPATADDTGGNNGDYFQSEPQTTPYFVRAGEPGPSLPCAATPKYAQDSQYRLVWVKVTQSGSPRIISQGQENYFVGQYDLDAGSSCHGCYNLRMRNVTFSDDNGRFYCQLLGPGGFVKDSKVAEVIVLVRPGPPQIGSQLPGPLREGQMGQLDCQSMGGNPPPKITWRFENNTDATLFARTRNATDLNAPTISSLSWPVSYRENHQYLRCLVWNEAMGENTAPMEAVSARFVVQYAPKVQTGPANPYSVEEQKEASLYCSADANPPARSYAWSYSLSELSSPSNSPTSNNQNWTIQVSTHQHRGIYTCTATNELGTGQDSLLLDVQYTPKISFVTGNNQSSSAVLVSENSQAVTVTCQPDANPPATAVTWTGPDGQTLSDNAVLSLPSVSRSAAGSYNCTAKNTLTLYGGGSMERLGVGTLEVKVKHAPGKAVINESEPAVVGGMVNLSCSADDPGAPAAQYRWKAPGQQDYESVARATYTIDNVQLDKAGEYSCLPFNEVGLGEASSHRLIIYQPAQIEEHLKPEDQKREGEAYELTCSARGHPAPNITWYKDDELIPESGDHWTSLSQIGSSSGDCSDTNSMASASPSSSSDQCSYKVVGTLKWTDGIRWNDKGYISCRAYNGAGRPAESKTLLKVHHKPVIVNDPNRPVVAAELGQQAIIQCKASANPEPMFRWSKGGQQGDLTSSDSAAVAGGKQYSMNMIKVNQSYDLYEQTLIIGQVGEDDFGEYQCKANNQMGESSFVFTLKKKTKPSPPQEFKSSSSTHRSLELSWIPGFDGGYEQSFTIEQVDEGLTYNVSEAVATSALPSLRHRRHVGIEQTVRGKYNVTNLLPSRTYSFRIKAWNRMGETEWSEKTSSMTADAPLDEEIKKPDQPVYNSDTHVLEVRPTLDPGKYCLLIYLRQPSGSWEMWNCVDPDSTVGDVPPATNMKVRFCNRYTMYCSEPTEVMTGVGAGFPAPIIVAICVAAVVLVALAAVIFFCCLRSRRRKQDGRGNGGSCLGGTNSNEKSKEQNAPKTQKKNGTASNVSSRNGTAKRDYEMETNQARPKAISGPYLTKNTPGPVVGLGVDQNTGSSKDSGVFTTSSATHPYGSNPNTGRNGNAYVPEPSGSLNGQVAYNGPNGHPHHLHGQPAVSNGNGPMMLNRPPSYDGHEHWGATDGYGLAGNGGGAYLNGHPYPHSQHSSAASRGHDYHDGGGVVESPNGNHPVNGSFYDANTPTSAMSSAFVDPYGGGVGFVDMNPNGGGGGGSGSGSGGGGGGDDSMNSGYSTPTQRRVMREIIV